MINNISGWFAGTCTNTTVEASATVAYAYLANSPLVQSLTFKQSGTTRLPLTLDRSTLDPVKNRSAVN